MLPFCVGPTSDLNSETASLGEGGKYHGGAHAPRTISLSAGERGDRKAVGEGLLFCPIHRRPEGLPHLPHEFIRVIQNHRVRNAQQSNADGP